MTHEDLKKTVDRLVRVRADRVRVGDHYIREVGKDKYNHRWYPVTKVETVEFPNGETVICICYTDTSTWGYVEGKLSMEPHHILTVRRKYTVKE